MSLAVVAASSTERTGGLPDLLETVPENGLLAVLDGPAEAQGLLSFDNALLSAVIEKQMTGVIGKTVPPPRPVTRTDAALAADLIDAVLREFEGPFLGKPDACWAAGFGYGSHVEGVRPLGLLLEDVDYRMIALELDLDQGRRQGRALLALPAEGRGGVHDCHTVTPEVPRDEAWHEGFGTAVRGADVRLEAIMHRLKLPFAQIRRLKVGDEIPLPAVSIDRVRLAGIGGGPFGVGRLGQSRGNRAVRISAFGDQIPGPDSAPNAVFTLPDLPGPGDEIPANRTTAATVFDGSADDANAPLTPMSSQGAGLAMSGAEGEMEIAPMALDSLPDLPQSQPD
ncbi:flagellar motor switch protein FliM [Tropicimonas isoalkanivorans]|uniref:Flagellar motor switch protein FliM n=2 Tax=Tropicimonas isoalkanivorans TaxID=441112 RepID=A0A1I1GL36_9RHOB|nr:flagellar motor switch protein FliM [Tropicimonas isoalkanivorans]